LILKNIIDGLLVFELIDLQWLLKKFQILELTRETEIDSFEIA
jgi:hypothetical protein